MLSLVNSGIRVVLIYLHTHARYITHRLLHVKPFPPRASLFSAPSASALCCGCRECRTHGRTTKHAMDQSQNTALGAEAGTRAASVHFKLCV